MCLEKTPSKCRNVQHKCHTDWRRIEPRPPNCKNAQETPIIPKVVMMGKNVELNVESQPQ